MNSRQLRYAVLLSEIGNFSQVAEKLSITQPALSKQILTLEKELGVQLFDRTHTPLTVTPAGQHFICEAKEMLYKEDQLLRSMEQFKTGEKGKVVVGITPFRSAYLVSTAIQKLRERFPGVQVQLVEERNLVLRKEVLEGKFDFAIINLPVDTSQLEVIPLEPDRLVLVMPEYFTQTHPRFATGDTIDFKECQDLPFSVVSPGQEMRTLFESLCTATGIRPTIVAEVVGLTTSWEMVNAGIAAALLPLQFVNSAVARIPLTVLELQNPVHLRQPAVVYKRGQYLSPYATYTISLLTQK